MVNPRHQTLQGRSIAKPGTPPVEYTSRESQHVIKESKGSIYHMIAFIITAWFPYSAFVYIDYRNLVRSRFFQIGQHVTIGFNGKATKQGNIPTSDYGNRSSTRCALKADPFVSHKVRFRNVVLSYSLVQCIVFKGSYILLSLCEILNVSKYQIKITQHQHQVVAMVNDWCLIWRSNVIARTMYNDSCILKTCWRD